MSDIAEFKNIPDVSFIDFLTLEQVQELFRADFIQAYKNATGQTLTLNPADPINLVLLAESNQYYQALQYVDRAGKQDLLKYTYGEYLDNIALRSGLTRKGAGKAITTLRFTLSATRSSAVAIPAGTRVCTGDNVYFATTEYAEIKPAAFAATTLRFESTGEHDDIEIPAGSVAATADGVRFKTTQGVTLAACAAAMATLRFTLSAARSEAVTISAGTKVYADVAARAYTFPFVTGETVTIEASEKATTTLRFYPKAGATTAVFVPIGSLYSAAGKIFVTDEDLEVAPDDEYSEVSATALLPGSTANNVAAGTAVAWAARGQDEDENYILSPTNSAPAIGRCVTATTSTGGVSNLTADVAALAQYAGAEGNGFKPGTINHLRPATMAPGSYTLSATNTDTSTGGSGSAYADAPAVAEEAGDAANGYKPAPAPVRPNENGLPTVTPETPTAKEQGVAVLVDTFEGVTSVRNLTETAGGYGSAYVDVPAEAEAPGESGNGYGKGDVNTLVDPIGYIGSVANTTETSGGTEEEDDDELTERVFYAPEGYSVAGPALAYISLAKQFRSDVRDVTVVRPEGTAGTVDIYILLAGGKLPTASDLAALLEFLSDKTRRPLNDFVKCKAPTEVPYTIDLTYTIAESDAAQVGTITEAVNQAVTDYADWQRTIGQDINPTALIARVRDAGAKWVELRSPARSAVTKSQVPKLTTQNVVYGGTEDD